MGFDYYTQSELVFEYIDDIGQFQQRKINTIIEGHHFYAEPEYDSDDTMNSYNIKYQIAINKHLDKLTYTEDLNPSNKLAFEPILSSICPGIYKLVRVYNDYTAWER